ncbi:MAG: DAK2 domain-containing protein [Thermoleophilia bacterium]|nr:DAK2 domain-containing protein [Thermoleophilia bacterium]
MNRRRVHELVAGARTAIEAHRRRIDDLNVYPVPDGDTGTNLTLTVRAIDEALRKEGPDDRAGLAREVARAALMGARGNSGVILSQIVRGATDALAQSDDLAKAFRSASDAAYRAVKKPVEGTMLTAIRAMAEAAERDPDLTSIIAAGDEIVRKTREMLPVLTEAGVVDAGAAGLVEVVRGLHAALTGETLPEPPELEEELGVDAIHQELSRFRYCTVFVVEGEELDLEGLERELEQIGDSLLVVGDNSALKVHVHTDDPGRALSLGVARGIVGGVEIANMHAQTQEREARLLHAVPDVAGAECALVAVASGEGNRALFESEGALVVDGGRTMNPSTADLIAAIETAAAPEVIVLPNNGNVIMSAEQAAEHASKTARVVPTRSLQAGLAALIAFDPSHRSEQNAEAMAEAVDAVTTGAVTIASRDVELNGISVQKGKWLGLADGEPVAGGETFDEVVHVVLERLLAEPRGLLTLLTGEDPPSLDELLSELAFAHPELELDVHEGGQPHYPLLLSAE